jgi:DNA repair protein RecN (Recombination protein N)
MMSAVLAELSGLDVNLKQVANALRDSTLQLEEVAFDLSRYLDKLDLDPGELVEVNDRLNTINRILNKYGDPIETTLAYRAEIGQNIQSLERATDDFSSLQAELEPLKQQLKRLGEELTGKRKSVAKKLRPLVEKQLAELGMEKATFTIELTPAAAAIPVEALPATPSGFDHVEFVAQTNPGQLPQPLRKIASGGELSRIMLALKGILAQSDRISVLVFDEIDANVGGRLGSIIGQKLRRLAEHHQVLCITHLPQIASYADRHLTARKQVIADQTATTVRTMTGPDRLEELAEMIGGQRITNTTRAQAQELLDVAQTELARSTGLSARNGKAKNAVRTG